MRLLYHQYQQDYLPDAMPTIKDVVEHVVLWTIGGVDHSRLWQSELSNFERAKIEEKVESLGKNGNFIFIHGLHECRDIIYLNTWNNGLKINEWEFSMLYF